MVYVWPKFRFYSFKILIYLNIEIIDQFYLIACDDLSSSSVGYIYLTLLEGKL